MYLGPSFVIQVKTFDNSFKKAKFVLTTIVSSNINDVIRAISNLLYSKIS